MQIKNYTQTSIVFNYFFATTNERTHYTHSRHLYYEGNTLYSYGRHFPLAVHTNHGSWILNGDRYSPTTNGHQNLTRSIAADHRFFTTHHYTWNQVQKEVHDLQQNHPRWPPNLLIALLRSHHQHTDCPICTAQKEGHIPLHSAIIPFTTLHAAGIPPEDIILLDVTRDTWEKIMRRNPTTGQMEEHQVHHLGASLFRHGRKRFLSSIDMTAGRQGQYYLVELQSHQVNTIEDAYRDLARRLSDAQYQKYQQGSILRQGEYFLEPHPELCTRVLQHQAILTTPPVKGVLGMLVKTPRAKEHVREILSRSSQGFNGGYTREQFRVIRRKKIPYYVILDKAHIQRGIPQDAWVNHGQLVINQPLVHQYDLSQGQGNPHTATEAIKTPKGVFIRRTLRHPEHQMIRMGRVWHQVYRNTAVHSWSALGGVD